MSTLHAPSLRAQLVRTGLVGTRGDRRRPGRSTALGVLPRQRRGTTDVPGFSRPDGVRLVAVETSPALDRAVLAPEPEVVPARDSVRVTRLTRRGRLVVVLALLSVVLAAMTALGGLATATHDAGTPRPVDVVEVGPGDTLYSIAGDAARPGHVREMVHRIQELNSLSDASLRVGQRLAVPRG